MQLQCPATQHTDRTVFICFTALENYVNVYIVSLWRESALMGLNRASEEGNLTARDEWPATHVSLSYTQMDINIIIQERRQTHLRQG